jgi:uncharacterized membrane protein YdjX (TVP38/TMEM64 family)
MPPAATELALYFAFMLAATSILSLPLAPATLLAAKVASPWLVAALASLASALAAVFDHWFVRRAFRLRLLEAMRQKAMFQRAERLAKVAPFWTTTAFAAFPVPFTIVRVLMPLAGYPRARYTLAVAIGRFARIFVIAAFGAIVDVPSDVLVALLVAGVGLAAAAALARRLGWIGARATEAPDAPARADDGA